MESLTLALAGLVLVAFGIFVFAGSKRCFRILAGGSNFLDLQPSEAQFRKEARRSGVTVSLVAVIFWCVGAWSFFSQHEGVRMACLIVGVASALAIIVLIGFSARAYNDLLTGLPVESKKARRPRG